MDDFTFLSRKQCFGFFSKLEIFKKRGTKASITDFSVLLGGGAKERLYKKPSFQPGYYWTKSAFKLEPFDDQQVWGVNTDGKCAVGFTSYRFYGARPVIPYSSICDSSSYEERAEDGIIEVEYGEYPQNVVSGELARELEKAYNSSLSCIRKTGKNYTINSGEYVGALEEPFKIQIIEEYSFNERKFVRVKANPRFHASIFCLSDTSLHGDGEYVWVEVEPIKWLIDEKNDIALSERILFAGIPFKLGRYKGDFRTTAINEFMNKYFSKDIIPSISKEIPLEEKKVDQENFNANIKVTEKKVDFIESENSMLKMENLRLKEQIKKLSEIVKKYEQIYSEQAGSEFFSTQEQLDSDIVRKSR